MDENAKGRQNWQLWNGSGKKRAANQPDGLVKSMLSHAEECVKITEGSEP